MDKYLKAVPSVRSGNNTDRATPDKRAREVTPPDKSKNAKKFNPNPKVVSKSQVTPTQNRFSALSVDDEDPVPFQNATKKKKVNNTPPIIIEMSYNWTLQKIRDCLVKYVKEFHMTCRGNKIVRVQCYSIKSHQQLKEGLLKENIAFHTFTRRDEKLPKAVIKGLPKFTIDQIPEELNILGFSGATVSEIKTLRPSECPPVLVHLLSGTDMGKFKQIKYLFNCSVQVEHYKPTKRPGTQCFRCQGFGHASRNCNRPPRCVKCALSHPTWECTKKDKETPAKCCNCNQDHPANYGQCDERLKYIDRIESRRVKLRNAVACEAAHSKKVETQTWAQIAGADKVKKQTLQELRPKSKISPSEWSTGPPPTTTMPTLQKQAQPIQRAGATITTTPHDLETIEMLEILTTIQSIKQEFSKCKTFMEKVILIVTHLGHHV